jgi:hypothetical protein
MTTSSSGLVAVAALAVLALGGCAGSTGGPDAGASPEVTTAAAPPVECTDEMGVRVTGGTPETFDPATADLPPELANALDPGIEWTCAVRVDYVTADDTHLVDYEFYLVSYDGTTPAAELKPAFDESLGPLGYQFSVGESQASEEQIDPDTGGLDADVDPLTLDSYRLDWVLSVPNAVFPSQTSTTIEVEFGGGGIFGLPGGPEFGDGDYRGTVTRVGYLLRVPYASFN